MKCLPGISIIWFAKAEEKFESVWVEFKHELSSVSCCQLYGHMGKGSRAMSFVARFFIEHSSF